MQGYTLERCVEIEVNCSVDEVYSLWDNLENMPKWMPFVKEVKIISEANHLSRWKFGLGGLLQIEWTSRITERIPLRSIKWESVSGVPNCGYAQFFSTDRGCLLRLTLAFNLPGGIVGALIKGVGVERWLEVNLQQGLVRFKALIEAEVSRKAG